MNAADVASVKSLLETAIHSDKPRAQIMMIASHSINLPKPVLALAYMQLNKTSEADLRHYLEQALAFVISLETGVPLTDALEDAGLPAALEPLLRSYVTTLHTPND